MSTLPLDGMPRPLFAATPARLSAWLDCPRKYRYAYVDRPAPPRAPAGAHASFGTSVHNALRAWVTAPTAERTREQARRAVRSAWVADGYRDDDQQAAYRARATEMVTAYVSRLDPRDEPVGVERTVAARLPGVAFSGRVDRIDLRDGELVVVDYKTGRAPLSEDDARGSTTLALYAVAAERTLRAPCRTVELHHVPTGEVYAYRHTDASLARQVGRAVDVAEEIRGAAAYPPRPGPGCRWCDFRRTCPDATGPEPEPWAALPPLDGPPPRDDPFDDETAADVLPFGSPRPRPGPAAADGHRGERPEAVEL